MRFVNLNPLKLLFALFRAWLRASCASSNLTHWKGYALGPRFDARLAPPYPLCAPRRLSARRGRIQRLRMTDSDPLRACLIALCRDALARLARTDRLDGEMLQLAANVDGTLAALDAEAGEAVPPAPGDRALIVDDGATVRIVLYLNDRRAAAATLRPVARNLMGWRSRASGEYRPDQTGHPRSSHPVLPLGQIAPAVVGC